MRRPERHWPLTGRPTTALQSGEADRRNVDSVPVGADFARMLFRNWDPGNHIHPNPGSKSEPGKIRLMRKVRPVWFTY